MVKTMQAILGAVFLDGGGEREGGIEGGAGCYGGFGIGASGLARWMEGGGGGGEGGKAWVEMRNLSGRRDSSRVFDLNSSFLVWRKSMDLANVLGI